MLLYSIAELVCHYQESVKDNSYIGEKMNPGSHQTLCNTNKSRQSTIPMYQNSSGIQTNPQQASSVVSAQHCNVPSRYARYFSTNLIQHLQLD